jgi:hypothetical protein
VVDIRLTQGVSYFGIRGFNHLKSPGVVGKIPVDPRAYPARKIVGANLSQRDRQVHLIAKDQKLLPFGSIEVLQKLRLPVVKAKRGNQRGT